ncbi:DUF4907 domain-containing protein [Chitinophaga sp. MM2321]|uniref:DUF4907 domain-containing protein n=1 Tax=Chitinophaga sp. MM2321 TaxID=3137178 RepID=UPI0032D5AB38
MTKRNILIVAGIVLAVLVFVAVKHRTVTPEKSSTAMVSLAVEPFEINGGWGYKVVMDGHPYIYQDVIPGVPGNRVFHSKEDALRVGNAVMEKLVQRKMPAMTQAELVKMQIAEAR